MLKLQNSDIFENNKQKNMRAEFSNIHVIYNWESHWANVLLKNRIT